MSSDWKPFFSDPKDPDTCSWFGRRNIVKVPVSSQLDLYVEGHPNQNPNMPFLGIDKIMRKGLYLCQNVLILEELKQS